MTLQTKITAFLLIFLALLLSSSWQAKASPFTSQANALSEILADDSYFTAPLPLLEEDINQEGSFWSSRVPELAISEEEIEVLDFSLSDPNYLQDQYVLDAQSNATFDLTMNPELVLADTCTEFSGVKSVEEIDLEAEGIASEEGSDADFRQGYLEGSVEQYYAEASDLQNEVATCIAEKRAALTVEANDFIKDTTFLVESRAKSDLSQQKKIIDENVDQALLEAEELEEKALEALEKNYQIMKNSAFRFTRQNNEEDSLEASLAAIEGQYNKQKDKILKMIAARTSYIDTQEEILTEEVTEQYENTLEYAEDMTESLQSEAPFWVDQQALAIASDEVKALETYETAWEEELGVTLPDVSVVEEAVLELDASGQEIVPGGDPSVPGEEVYTLEEVTDKSLDLSSGSPEEKMEDIYMTSVVLEGATWEEAEAIVEDRKLYVPSGTSAKKAKQSYSYKAQTMGQSKSQANKNASTWVQEQYVPTARAANPNYNPRTGSANALVATNHFTSKAYRESAFRRTIKNSLGWNNKRFKKWLRESGVNESIKEGARLKRKVYNWRTRVINLKKTERQAKKTARNALKAQIALEAIGKQNSVTVDRIAKIKEALKKNPGNAKLKVQLRQNERTLERNRRAQDRLNYTASSLDKKYTALVGKQLRAIHGLRKAGNEITGNKKIKRLLRSKGLPKSMKVSLRKALSRSRGQVASFTSRYKDLFSIARNISLDINGVARDKNGRVIPSKGLRLVSKDKMRDIQGCSDLEAALAFGTRCVKKDIEARTDYLHNLIQKKGFNCGARNENGSYQWCRVETDGRIYRSRGRDYQKMYKAGALENFADFNEKVNRHIIEGCRAAAGNAKACNYSDDAVMAATLFTPGGWARGAAVGAAKLAAAKGAVATARGLGFKGSARALAASLRTVPGRVAGGVNNKIINPFRGFGNKVKGAGRKTREKIRRAGGTNAPRVDGGASPYGATAVGGASLPREIGAAIGQRARDAGSRIRGGSRNASGPRRPSKIKISKDDLGSMPKRGGADLRGKKASSAAKSGTLPALKTSPESAGMNWMIPQFRNLGYKTSSTQSSRRGVVAMAEDMGVITRGSGSFDDLVRLAPTDDVLQAKMLQAIAAGKIPASSAFAKKFPGQLDDLTAQARKAIDDDLVKAGVSPRYAGGSKASSRADQVCDRSFNAFIDACSSALSAAVAKGTDKIRSGTGVALDGIAAAKARLLAPLQKGVMSPADDIAEVATGLSGRTTFRASGETSESLAKKLSDIRVPGRSAYTTKAQREALLASQYGETVTNLLTRTLGRVATRDDIYKLARAMKLDVRSTDDLAALTLQIGNAAMHSGTTLTNVGRRQLLQAMGIKGSSSWNKAVLNREITKNLNRQAKVHAFEMEKAIKLMATSKNTATLSWSEKLARARAFVSESVANTLSRGTALVKAGQEKIILASQTVRGQVVAAGNKFSSTVDDAILRAPGASAAFRASVKAKANRAATAFADKVDNLVIQASGASAKARSLATAKLEASVARFSTKMDEIIIKAGTRSGALQASTKAKVTAAVNAFTKQVDEAILSLGDKSTRINARIAAGAEKVKNAGLVGSINMAMDGFASASFRAGSRVADAGASGGQRLIRLFQKGSQKVSQGLFVLGRPVQISPALRQKLQHPLQALGFTKAAKASDDFPTILSQTHKDLVSRATYAPRSKTAAAIRKENSSVGIYGRGDYRTADRAEALANYHTGEVVKNSLAGSLGRMPTKDDLLQFAGAGSKDNPGLGLAVKSSDTVEQLLLQIGNAARNPSLLTNVQRRALLKGLGAKGYSRWNKGILNSQITNTLRRQGKEHARVIGALARDAEKALAKTSAQSRVFTASGIKLVSPRVIAENMRGKARNLLPYMKTKRFWAQVAVAGGVGTAGLAASGVSLFGDDNEESELAIEDPRSSVIYNCPGPRRVDCPDQENNSNSKESGNSGASASGGAASGGSASGGSTSGGSGSGGSGSGAGNKPSAIRDGVTSTPEAEEILEAPGTVAQTPEEVANPFADEAGSQGDNPSAAALKIGNELCSAVVVDPEWLLTAAHCVYSDTVNKVLHPTGSIQAVIGQKNIASPVYTSVSQVIPHPGYTAREKEFDVALLRLSKKTDALPMPIAQVESSDAWAAGSKASVAGWGLACKGCTPSSTISVREVEIAEQNICATAYKSSKPAMNITANMICAKSPAREACTGDSGGPLSVNVGGRDELVGLVSFGVGCNNPKYPGVYTYLPTVAPWIGAEIVQDLSVKQKLTIMKAKKRTQKTKALNLDNKTLFPVPLKGIVLQGSKRFSLVPGSCGDVLAPGKNCTLRVAFKGRGKKSAKGKLTVVGMKGTLAESKLLGKKAKKAKQAKKATKTKKKA